MQVSSWASQGWPSALALDLWIIAHHEWHDSCINIWIVTKLILTKLCHCFIGTKSGPRVGIESNLRITTQIRISDHWPDNIKLLKILYTNFHTRFQQSTLLCTFSPSNWQYQCTMKTLKPHINVKDNCRLSDTIYLVSGTFRRCIDDFMLHYLMIDVVNHWYHIGSPTFLY